MVVLVVILIIALVVVVLYCCGRLLCPKSYRVEEHYGADEAIEVQGVHHRVGQHSREEDFEAG